MTDYKHVALDFETSGLRPEDGHVPMTLGFAWRNENGDLESHMFKIQLPGPFQVEALTVNNLSYQSLRDGSAADYDFAICKFLQSRFGDIFKMKGQLVPVGWNVGSFDMRFMHKYFPEAAKFFSHRPLELNTMAFCIEEMFNFQFKKDAKQRAMQFLGENNWHNAEFDAKASLLVFEYGLELLHS